MENKTSVRGVFCLKMQSARRLRSLIIESDFMKGSLNIGSSLKITDLPMLQIKTPIITEHARYLGKYLVGQAD